MFRKEHWRNFSLACLSYLDKVCVEAFFCFFCHARSLVITCVENRFLISLIPEKVHVCFQWKIIKSERGGISSWPWADSVMALVLVSWLRGSLGKNHYRDLLRAIWGCMSCFQSLYEIYISNLYTIKLIKDLASRINVLFWINGILFYNF